MSINKKTARLRRSVKTRARIKRQGATRLCVTRSSNNIYAQVISPCGSTVLASASTMEKTLKSTLKNGGNKDAAEKVGALLAERATAAGVKQVAFDRSGFKFHGRVKALADAARAGGIEF